METIMGIKDLDVPSVQISTIYVTLHNARVALVTPGAEVWGSG